MGQVGEIGGGNRSGLERRAAPPGSRPPDLFAQMKTPASLWCSQMQSCLLRPDSTENPCMDEGSVGDVVFWPSVTYQRDALPNEEIVSNSECRRGIDCGLKPSSSEV
jgi:hypothetical protein